MSLEARIRPAVEADLEAMTQLIGRLFALEPDFVFDPVKVRRGLLLLLDREGSAALWVADLADRVVGLCTAQIVISTAAGGPVAWVEDVVVCPDLRGQGVGRRLMDSVTAWAQRRGLARLQLLADRENENALAFYRRLGWQDTRLDCLRLRTGE